MEFDKNDDNEFVMLSYIYNQIVGWCHLVPNLDYVKIWHSTADIDELKFMGAIRWNQTLYRYQLDESLIKNHNVNYRKYNRLINHFEKTERKIRKCRLEIYKRWFQHFDEIQEDINEIIDILKPPTWRGRLILRK